MKKDAKPSRYGINGAVMDSSEMSDELRAEYENPDYTTGSRSGVVPNSAALLSAVGALFIGLAWGQSGNWGLPTAPSTYILIGSLATCAAGLLRWRWEKKQKVG